MLPLVVALVLVGQGGCNGYAYGNGYARSYGSPYGYGGTYSAPAYYEPPGYYSAPPPRVYESREWEPPAYYGPPMAYASAPAYYAPRERQLLGLNVGLSIGRRRGGPEWAGVSYGGPRPHYGYAVSYGAPVAYDRAAVYGGCPGGVCR